MYTCMYSTCFQEPIVTNMYMYVYVYGVMNAFAYGDECVHHWQQTRLSLKVNANALYIEANW